MKLLHSTFLLSAGLLAGVLSAQQLSEGSIQVLRATGEVSMITSEDGEATPLYSGAILDPESTVMTGPFGATTLIFSNGARIQLGASSSLTIEQFDQASFPESMGSYSTLTGDPSTSIASLKLNYGELTGQVTDLQPDSVFDVQTPTTASTILGTTFAVDFSWNPTTFMSTSSFTNVTGSVVVAPEGANPQQLDPEQVATIEIPFVPSDIVSALGNLPPQYAVDTVGTADGLQYTVTGPDGLTSTIETSVGADGSQTIVATNASDESWTVSVSESRDMQNGMEVVTTTRRVEQPSGEVITVTTERMPDGSFTRSVTDTDGNEIARVEKSIGDNKADVMLTDGNGNRTNISVAADTIGSDSGKLDYIASAEAMSFTSVDPVLLEQIQTQLAGVPQGSTPGDEPPAGEADAPPAAPAGPPAGITAANPPPVPVVPDLATTPPSP